MSEDDVSSFCSNDKLHQIYDFFPTFLPCSLLPLLLKFTYVSFNYFLQWTFQLYHHPLNWKPYQLLATVILFLHRFWFLLDLNEKRKFRSVSLLCFFSRIYYLQTICVGSCNSIREKFSFSLLFSPKRFPSLSCFLV